MITTTSAAAKTSAMRTGLASVSATSAADSLPVTRNTVEHSHSWLPFGPHASTMRGSPAPPTKRTTAGALNMSTAQLAA